MNKRHVVIIGSGISGLSASWHLKDHAKVTVLEKADYLGGHTHTHTLTIDEKSLQLDSGFIVFNNRTYPGLLEWFTELDVKTHPADMSFSVSLDDGKFEWAGTNLRSIFAQGRRVYDIKFLKMLRDIIRFNRNAPKYIAASNTNPGNLITLGHYLDQHGYDSYFQTRYLLPMAGTIWSCPIKEIRNFPLKFFISFCENHGLLSILNRPQWFSVKGGSRRYVEAMLTAIKKHDVSFKTEKTAKSIIETSIGLEVITEDRNKVQHRIACDDVILASHADESAHILKDLPTPLSQELSRIKFQQNIAIIHEDKALMPEETRAWASWNYLSHTSTEENSGVAVTYFMNKLQHLPTQRNLFVTLNPIKKPDPRKIYKSIDYTHPVMDLEREKAVQNIQNLQGGNHIWLAGAWMGNGFHESGYQSGLWAANKIIDTI